LSDTAPLAAIIQTLLVKPDGLGTGLVEQATSVLEWVLDRNDITFNLYKTGKMS
jgi:hypothetical protein